MFIVFTGDCRIAVSQEMPAVKKDVLTSIFSINGR